MKIAILLATYNGAKHLQEQINSIYCQSSVEIKLFCRDDGSDDNTIDIIKKNNLEYISGALFKKGAAQNFFNLICFAPIADYDYVSFADQDDIWFFNKLENALNILSKNKYDGYSSSYIHFSANGDYKYENKRLKIKDFDYIFQSPGPGCTFVISKKLAMQLKNALIENVPAANGIQFHDSFIYFYARASGLNWFIDSSPSLLYRQHMSNVLGANTGFASYYKRLKYLNGKYFQNQLQIFSRLCRGGEMTNVIISAVCELSLSDRLFLIRNSFKFRRDLKGIIVLILFFLFSWN